MTKKINPLKIIRRSVRESAQQFGSLFQNTSKQRLARTFRYESLEDRRVLTATGFDTITPVTDVDSGYVAAEELTPLLFPADQDAEIQSLVVDVNGKQFELTAQHNQLRLNAGDKLQVIKIGFHSAAQTGVFAAEGYVNKISDLNAASLIDYNDGRFSARESNQDATGGVGTVGGFSEAWKVDDGWDRLSINLMHYTESSTEVAGRFFVMLQIGQPDFAFDSEVLDQVRKQEIVVGDAVAIPGRWVNGVEGTFHNYAEVNIYDSSNPDVIVWAGAMVGGANSTSSVNGNFVNSKADDAYSESWMPDAAGEYTVKYYLDPEQLVTESNEGNNYYELQINVAAEIAPPAIVVEAEVKGLEDTPIKLQISTDAKAVLIAGVPTNAKLSAGTQVARGTYEVSREDLVDLTITPAPQSDVDFQLTVVPIGTAGALPQLTQTINVNVIPVVDGGQLNVRDFGIFAGGYGAMPLSSYFADLDGSETHDIAITGLPDFMELSAGEKSGTTWHLQAKDLENLQIKSTETKNTKGWTKYNGNYIYKAFDVKFEIQSKEADSTTSTWTSGKFAVYAWQYR